MIKIEHVETYGWEAAVRGARNPMNSWHLSDSYWTHIEDAETQETAKFEYFLGEKDLALLKKLSSAGSDHGKFLRMITVTLDITAPLYWWKEADTYAVGVVKNSCSTMHKIHSKPIELSDFSVDDFYLGDDISLDLKDMFINVVADCETLRMQYLVAAENAKKKDCFTEAERKHFSRQAKRFWKGLIQLLPTSYNQKRTVQLNYQVLKAMYHARKAHKLDEWRTFCSWIETLPYAKELIVGEG